MKKIALYGSTGSIGTQVLSCVRRYPEEYKITSLVAGSNAKLLGEQIREFKPEIASLIDPKKLNEVGEIGDTLLFTGENAAMHALDCDCDLAFVAITGFAGLAYVLAALKAGKNVALANKETLVAGGEIVTKLAKEKGLEIIPVDSEHSALWQCLSLDKERSFERLIITASGGAFRDTPIENLPFMTAADALKHPNWRMGKKITVDCATMVNKGLEVIEAMWLFDCPLDKIKVVMHPESIVHSMVEFADGAIMAQMGAADMELPISLALSYPERKKGPEKLDIFGKTLHFFEMDKKRYPCFDLVMQSIKQGKNYPCAMSSANEAAVGLFLDGKIGFTEIYDYIAYALEKTEKNAVDYLSLVATDKAARQAVLTRFLTKSSR